MKANGFALCGAFALSLLMAGIGTADDLLTYADIRPTDAASGTLNDTADEPLAAAAAESPADALSAGSADCYSHSCYEREPFWFVSAEMLFMDVSAETGGRINLSFDDNTTPGTEISFLSGTGLYNEVAAPRLTLGCQFGEKWGMVARYFSLTDNTNEFPRLTPGTTPMPTFGTYFELDSVKMHTIDLEAVRSFSPGKTKIDATIGARQAAIDVDSQLMGFGVITSGNFANLTLSNGCAFDGAGLTSALMLRRQIGDSPFSLFAGGRGSKLWGHSDSYGRSVGSVASSPSAPLIGAATVTRNNAEADLIIWEAQVGGQLEFELKCIPAVAFLRVALEYQNWDINGLPTGGAGFGGTIGDLTTNSFSRAGLGDTELKGLAVATGFTW